MNFMNIKKMYDQKLWSKNMVRTAVRKGLITKEEFALIVGQKF